MLDGVLNTPLVLGSFQMNSRILYFLRHGFKGLVLVEERLVVPGDTTSNVTL